MPLNEEQKKRIEENRQRALAKRKNVPNVPIAEKLSTIQTKNKETIRVPGPGLGLSKQNVQPSSLPPNISKSSFKSGQSPSSLAPISI